MIPFHRPLAVAALSIAPFAYGQSDVVIVTATRTPQRVSQLVSDVTVITRDEIEQAGHSSLPEILQAQPGLEIGTSGGFGTATDIHVRGANSDQVIVLIDGLRVGSATVGTTPAQHIAPSQIERIEIVRGPMSSLYGADAIGGVIQIFTRAADGPPQPRGSAGFGSYRTQEFTAGYGGTVGDTSFNVNAGHLDSQSFSATKPTVAFGFNPDRDPYRNTSLSARLAHRFTPDHELGATAFQSNSRVHVDFNGVGFDDIQDQTLEAYGAFSRNRFMPWWQSTLRLGRGVDDLTSRTSPTDVFKTIQDQALWQNDFRTPMGDFLAAAEHLEQKVSGTTEFPVRSRTIQSVLGGYTGRFDRHTLQLNVRHDDNSQFDDKTTGSIGYGFAFAPGWRASAAYGTAFKAPTFNELYFPPMFGCPAFGNPNLRPESSRNMEAALRYEHAAHAAGVVAYRNRIRDLISGVGNPCQRAENVEKAQITGVTLTYGFALAGWAVRASADFLNPENETTDKVLRRRAKRHGALSIARRAGAWTTGVEAIASGPRFDDADNMVRLSGYTIFNLFGEYRITGAWSLFARMNNLFDKDYELAQGFNTPGFNAFVGVRYEPK